MIYNIYFTEIVLFELISIHTSSPAIWYHNEKQEFVDNVKLSETIFALVACGKSASK